MKNGYDLFEKFSNGSSLWRSSFSEFEAACLQLQELAQKSENQFYAINLTTGEVFAFNSERDAHGFRTPSKTERRSKSQAAEYVMGAADRALYENRLHEDLRVTKRQAEMHNQGATTAIDAERRRSERLLLDMALVVRGESTESQPFQEKTFTISVSAHGTLLVLATKVALGQTLLLSGAHSQDEVVGRVVRFGIPRGGLAQVGFDFAQPAPELWPLESPPDSWRSLSS